MDLDLIRPKLRHAAHRLQHIRLGLVGEAEDEMDAGQRLGRAFPQTGVALQKIGVGVASVDGRGSPVVGRLQSQLHRQHRPLGQLAE